MIYDSILDNHLFVMYDSILDNHLFMMYDTILDNHLFMMYDSLFKFFNVIFLDVRNKRIHTILFLQ